MIRVIQVITCVSAEATGPTYSVKRLSEALAKSQNDVHLMTIGDPASSIIKGYRHTTYAQDYSGVPILERLFMSSSLFGGLLGETQRTDLVHNHGLWLMPNVYSAWAASRHGRPLVVSPRGTLAAPALSISRGIKRGFWTLFQGRAVRSAVCLHATSEQEYEDIRNAGLRQPVAIIPNGVDIPSANDARKDKPLRTLLYLGRIHPIKGIDNLLRAWQQVAVQFPNWQLRLVGPGSAGHLAQIKLLMNELSLKRVVLAGPRYGEQKQAEYADADLYILPSHTENFGMTVAEALAQGVPVITTTGTPWEGVLSRGCGWWISPTVTGIEKALYEALPLDQNTLVDMGRIGRSWMEHDFSWSSVAAYFEETYRWILSGGSPPIFIRLN
jgi:glycosyltransferase involved in cell wall biosynthesis